MGVPLFKILIRPVLPIQQSWVDAFHVLLVFMLLSSATIFFFKIKRKYQKIRFVHQIVGSFFILFAVHVCFCVLRKWAFGLSLIGKDNLLAFGLLFVGFLLAAFGFTAGRVFCGWLCPLGFFLELVGRLAKFLSDKKIARWLLLSCLSIIYLTSMYLDRPKTQFISEFAPAMWVVFLLITLFMVIAKPELDGNVKKFRYFSFALWLTICALGIFVHNPWCIVYGNVLYYTSISSFLTVVCSSLLITRGWCRYICPVGAFLSILSRGAMVKIKAGEGKDCKRVCPMGAINKGQVEQTSCIYCGLCIEKCGFQKQIKV